MHRVEITQTLPVVERITIPPRDMNNISEAVVFLRSEYNMSAVVFCLKLMSFILFFFFVREPNFIGLNGFHQVSSPFRSDAFVILTA